jgi:hypothetical protein
MSTDELSKEQRILRLMRKTLGNVVKDVTPYGGRTSPLSDETVQDIKDSFALISAREKELSEQLGFNPAQPYYVDDEPPKSKVVSIVKPKRDTKD